MSQEFDEELHLEIASIVAQAMLNLSELTQLLHQENQVLMIQLKKKVIKD